jgi:hypothetical protein
MHERMMDNTALPTDGQMVDWIGQPLAQEWTALRAFLSDTYDIAPVYNPGGKRYGWNLQYRVGSRPLCEMYPERGSFTALVILGKAALDQAMEHIETFNPVVRHAVEGSPRYRDGCWMYIRVSDPLTCHEDVKDIEALILIKRTPSGKKTPSS